MKNKRILCLFDYVARTGYGTVTKNIVENLRKEFGDNLQLDIIAINYFGEPFYEDKNTYVISAKLNDDKEDDFGRFFFLKTLKESNDYDGIFILQDIGIISPIIEHLEYIKNEKRENNRKSFKSIFYFPIDCEILIKSLTNKLEFFDILATYTNYGKEEIVKYRPDLKTKIKVVPHGNNSKDFYPMDFIDVVNFRKEYFGENSSKFIITNINRNQSRKDIPNTIFGFIEAKEIWDNRLPPPFLYLHLHPKDPLGWDIRAIMQQTNLVEDVDYKLLPKEFEDSMVDVEMLNKIYNASDVFLTTSLGEGWGLTYSEAASCKVPIVCPYYTSFIEMSNYGKNAYMLDTLYPICSIVDNMIRKQTDIIEIGETLEYVAQSRLGLLEDVNAKANLEERIENNYNWVKKLEWKEVCKVWIEHFKSVF